MRCRGLAGSAKKRWQAVRSFSTLIGMCVHYHYPDVFATIWPDVVHREGPRTLRRRPDCRWVAHCRRPPETGTPAERTGTRPVVSALSD
jgi:hypothetical protein